MEHKAQKHLYISRADTRGHLSRPGIPLKQITFRTQVLPFGIGACWSHNRNLSMSGYKLTFDFFKEPQGFFTQGEQLSLFFRFRSFGKEVLKMELHLFRERVTVLTHLRQTILSKEQDGFCSGNAPLFVHTDL